MALPAGRTPSTKVPGTVAAQTQTAKGVKTLREGQTWVRVAEDGVAPGHLNPILNPISGMTMREQCGATGTHAIDSRSKDGKQSLGGDQ